MSERLEQVAAVSKPLEIGCDRTCDCPPTHINCLTAKEWLKAQIGVWQFHYEGRDIRDKDKHPATYPIALSSRLIELFTHQGELVVDPSVGNRGVQADAHEGPITLSLGAVVVG